MEAALVLPVLLCAFFCVVFLIKAVYTYELIQHALDETASEIASAGYIYHVSGIRDIHDSARNGINDRSELFKGQITSVFDAYDNLKNIKNSVEQGIPSVSDSAELIDNAGQNFGRMLEEAESIVSNPLDELKSIVCYIASDTLDDAKTQLFTPVVKLYMRKHIVTEGITDADERLRILNVADGFGGMDFSESSFLADKEENIDIVVRYRVQLQLPIRFGPGLEFVQRSRAKAWLSGDESQGVMKDNSGAAEDIWSLTNFQRGRKIQRLFGANLPSNFPVIAKFENGKAVMIKSMDLTAASYQTGENAGKTLLEYVDKLAGYKGQETPWGSDNIVIREEDIISRELVLVIPKNELSGANEQLLQEVVNTAASKGIILVVERYGTKVIKEEEEDSGDSGDAGSSENAGDAETAGDAESAASAGSAGSTGGAGDAGGAGDT